MRLPHSEAQGHRTTRGPASATLPVAVHVLLIEDNPLDARAVARAVAAWSDPVEVVHLTDADAALARLRDPAVPRPALILLDLSLPGRDGHDVLESVKGDPALRRIPVIVLTTSASERDIGGSYDRGANAFVTKPSDLAAWNDALARIESFWMNLASLPHDSARDR